MSTTFAWFDKAHLLQIDDDALEDDEHEEREEGAVSVFVYAPEGKSKA